MIITPFHKLPNEDITTMIIQPKPWHTGHHQSPNRRELCRFAEADVADRTVQRKRLSRLNDVGHLSPHPSMLTSHHFLKINVVNDDDDFADYVDL